MKMTATPLVPWLTARCVKMALPGALQLSPGNDVIPARIKGEAERPDLFSATLLLQGGGNEKYWICYYW